MKLFEKLTAEQEKYLAKLLSKTEAKVTDIYRAALIELKAELLDLASRYNQKGFLVQSEMNRFQRYSSMMGSLRGKIADSMGLAHSEMKKTVVETYLETRGMTAYAMDQTAGGTLGFGRVDPKDLEKAVNDKYSKLADSKALEGDKKKAFATVKNQINVSMARGEDVGTTANRVAEVLGFKYKDGTFLPNGRGELYKAMRIARTETHRVQSQGQVDTIAEAKDLGVDLVMVWDAALDDRTRDTHGEMDGQIADEEGKFTLPGGALTQGPGMSGIASEDINCRCVARPQVKGFPPGVRRVGDGTKPWQSYKEWKEGLNSNPVDPGKPEKDTTQNSPGKNPETKEGKLADFNDFLAKMDRTSESDVTTAGEKFLEVFAKDSPGTAPYGDDLLGALTQFRAFGADSPMNWEKGSNVATKTAFEEARKYYPKGWWDKLESSGLNDQGWKATNPNRGYCIPSQRKIAKNTKGDTNFDSTMVHEWAHVMEYYIPDVVKLEQSFWKRRTGDENFKRLMDLFPGRGYARHEVTKEDKFVHPYMGRFYGGAAWEILSMGMEILFKNRFKQFRGLDSDLERFIIGMMVSL